jgi:hypothetical protein
MDAVQLQSLRTSLRSLYLQQQRWAYGVEHFPYIVLESLRRKKIPLHLRLSLVGRAFSGTYSWGTSAFYLTVVGWLPLTLNRQFQDHVAASHFPIVTQMLLSITWLGLLVSGAVTIAILNLTNNRRKPIATLTMLIQWITIPIATIFFGALPGIDAQTRLMLGKYLGFRVTEKKVNTP